MAAAPEARDRADARAAASGAGEPATPAHTGWSAHSGWTARAEDSGADGRDAGALTSWRRFYDERREVDVAGVGTFTVYSTAAPHPRCPVVLLLHGANYSAMSFALLVPPLKRLARVIAYDARGHGLTRVGEAAAADLSAAALASDCEAVLEAVLAADGSSSGGSGGGDAPPRPVVLVGHSMGGAIATHVAARWQSARTGQLAGLVVMDVVEGAALAALPRMQQVVAAMPPAFASVGDAVAWAVDAGQLRLRASAEITVPYNLEHVEPAAAAAANSGGSGEVLPWQWRARRFMRDSAPFWEGWFTGVTQRFLSCRAPCMLVVADVDALDKELVVGQMQGRYRLQVVMGAGHVVHEDAPDRVAEFLLSFMSRAGLTGSAEKLLLERRLLAARSSGGGGGSGSGSGSGSGGRGGASPDSGSDRPTPSDGSPTRPAGMPP